MKTKTSFSAVCYEHNAFYRFFKIQNLGRHTMQKYVSDGHNECEIKGEGIAHGLVLHGLRGIVITRLFEAGHSDASVALKSGHRDHRSFAAYQNLRGAIGAQQQEDILGAAVCISSDQSARALSSGSGFSGSKLI